MELLAYLGGIMYYNLARGDFYQPVELILHLRNPFNLDKPSLETRRKGSGFNSLKKYIVVGEPVNYHAVIPTDGAIEQRLDSHTTELRLDITDKLTQDAPTSIHGRTVTAVLVTSPSVSEADAPNQITFNALLTYLARRNE